MYTEGSFPSVCVRMSIVMTYSYYLCQVYVCVPDGTYGWILDTLHLCIRMDGRVYVRGTTTLLR